MDRNWRSGDDFTSQLHDQDDPTKVCWCKGATNLMEVKCVRDLMALLRSSVREDVEDAVMRVLIRLLPSLQIPALRLRSSADLAESSASRSLQLHFVGTLPDTLLTSKNIQDQGASLTVELQDISGSRVEAGPESSAKIQIVALDGDFKVEDRDHWTHEEFNKNVVPPRKGRRPLLVGECDISLNKGAAVISNISFTDNSKCTRSEKYRLGAQVMEGIPPKTVISEAVTKAFRVKEFRTQSYQKHKTPSSEDEIWRLECIGKTGVYHQRLAEVNVRTVKDFLQLYHTDAKRLQKILRAPEKTWLRIVKNAELCLLTNEHYRYYDETRGVELILDCVFKIVSVMSVGQNSKPYEDLDDPQKECADRMREIAYEKRSELPKIYLPTNHDVQPQHKYPSSIPCTNMQFIHPTATDLGEPVTQVNTYSTNLQPYPLEYENDYQLEPSPGTVQDLERIWENEIWDLALLQEERGNDFEASTNDNITSKLKAACYVTKAAVLFMVSIQQESSAPRKKQKLQ